MNKLRKEKIVMSISVGLTALVLTAITFTQFKTVEQTDITAIETMRETELRTELASWKTKVDEITLKLTETQNTISQYKLELSTATNDSDVAKKEVNDYEKYLGYTDLQGEGIVITLQDKVASKNDNDNDDDFKNEERNIESYDLLMLVNELKLAGAEAISINDERIVSLSDITMINNKIILVNTRRISGPYVVKAIGDKKYLESAITIKGGYVDEINANGKMISYEVQDNILVPKYSGNISFEYAKKVEKEKE